jgi:SNF family Na+-dependent transporter
LREIDSEGRRFRLGRLWTFAIKYVCPLLILAVLAGQFL